MKDSQDLRQYMSGLRSPQVLLEEWRLEQLRESRGIKVNINVDILKKLKELPVLTPVLGDYLDNLKVESGGSVVDSGGSVVDLESLLKIFFKILDLKKSIYSIGLKEGFILSRNFNERMVYGIISDHVNVLVGEKFIEKLKEEIDEINKKVKKVKKEKEKEKEKERLRKEWLEKCLENKESIFEEYSRSVLKNPLDKLLYYNLLIEVLTVYLYVVSLYLSELISKELCMKELKLYEIRSDFEALSEFFNSRISTSLREKMKKVNPKIRKQVIAAYDTEYKTVSYGKNKLVSAQLSISGSLVLEVTTRTSYEFDIIHTMTQEKIKSEKENRLEGLLISVESLKKYFEDSISSVRQLKYGKFDELMSSLVLKLKKDDRLSNCEDQKNKGGWLFKTPQIPTLKRLLFYDDQIKIGLKWESLLAEILEESGVNEELDQELFVLQKKMNGNCGVKDLPKLQEVVYYEGNIIERELKEYKIKSFRIVGNEGCKDIVIQVSNEVYLISHFNVADLSMIEDWDKVKDRNIDIIGKSFVSIKGAIKTKGYKIYIRDTMLLASAAAQSLEKLGEMHKLPKGVLDEKDYLDMEYFLRKDPKRYREYALNDSDIVLAHGVFVLKFAFKLGSSRIPCSLGSLSRLSLKKYWDSEGYKGYQVDPEYILGDPVKVCNPLGINKLGTLGSAYGMYLAGYKGGRNEGLAYGRDKEGIYFDWDMTSCYTTVMSLLGNPDYSKGHYLSEKELKEMDDEDIFNSYTIMLVEIEQKTSVKYPIVPMLARGEKSNWVYSRQGEAFITGLEYIKLKHLKSSIKVLSCFYIPFEKNAEGKIINKPYFKFITYVQSKRLEYGKGSSSERMWKDIGNMCYGSSVTGLSNKMKYNPRTDQTERMVGTYISNPLIGGWITSYVRVMIGESMNNIDNLNGEILSVTTDGFCCSELEEKEKNGFVTNKSSIEERMIGSVNSLILSGRKSLKEEEEIKKRIYFLDKTREARVFLTEAIKGKGKGDPSCYELKTFVKGMTQLSTRLQCSDYVDVDSEKNKIVATTGLSRRGFSHEKVSEIIGSTYEGKKELSQRQLSLIGANDNYKKGLHCTPSYSVKSFKTKYDSRREVIIPEGLKKDYLKKGISLPNDVMYKTEAYQRADDSTLDRGIMDTWKNPSYLKNSSIRLLPSTKHYENLNERSVINDVLSCRPVDVTEKDPSSLEFNKKKEISISKHVAIECLAEFRVKDIDSKLRNVIKLRNKLRLVKLVSSLKVNDRWGVIEKAGGLATIELNRFLATSNMSVLRRFLPL